MIATFVVKIVAMTIARDSIEQLVAIKVAARTHIATFGFAKVVVAKKVVANKGVSNEVVVIAIANVMWAVNGYQILQADRWKNHPIGLKGKDSQSEIKPQIKTFLRSMWLRSLRLLFKTAKIGKC